MTFNPVRPQMSQVWVCRNGLTFKPDFLGASDMTGLTANQVLYANSSGTVAQSSGLTFDGTTLTLGTSQVLAVSKTTGTTLTVSSTQASTTTATGAAVISGGLGVAGAIYAGSLQNTPIGSTTASTGAFTTISASGQITSTVSTGTAPLVIASTTAVTNLNASLLLGSTWAVPGTIGSTTPSSGAFTSLSASGTLTLSGGTVTYTTSTTFTANTSDGSDNIRILFGGGGAVSSSRGSYFAVHGNEFASNAGCTIFQIGDATSANFQVNGNSGTCFSVTNTGSVQVAPSFAGDYALKVSNGSGTGRGLRAQPGADSVNALAVLNAGGTTTTFAVLGSGDTSISGSTASSSTSTGALVVTGGAGIGGQITADTGVFATRGLVGATSVSSAITSFSGNPYLSVVGSGATAAQVHIAAIGANANGADLFFTKTRATDTTAGTSVNSGDTLAYIDVGGANGTSYQEAASIKCISDGTPSSTSMPGRWEFYSTPSGSNTPLLRMTITNGGSVVMGSAALATTATDGFFYADSCAGTPTGVPTAQTGRIPLIYDSTNNKLYAYNGAWKSVTLA